MDVLGLVKKHNGFDAFNPVQEKAISAGLLEKSILVSAPTASGKTLVAEIAALNTILNGRKKVVYTCPLRALASEHGRDFKEKYSREFRIRAALSTGDFDSGGQFLSNKDIIFTTNEKLNSLLNHNAEWLKHIGLLIVDEIHTLGSDRGPTLEMVITKLKFLNKDMQTLGLSATVPNSEEIAKWLGARLVVSDYRPVKLSEGVFHDGVIGFKDRDEKIKLEEDEVTSLAIDTLAKGKQALIFANTRKNSESYARRLSKITEKKLTEQDKKTLEKASAAILNVLEQPTEQCRTIAELVRRGTCFHNAGLLQKQRHIVETVFKKGHLKFISSTPTLCLVPETNVWGTLNDFQVNSLSEKQKVLTLKGTGLQEIHPTEVQKIENTKSVIQIESVSGHSIKLTSNHQILVKRNGQKLLIQAEECKKGDRIATVGKIQANNESSQYGAGKFDYLGADFFYFIGCMLGDGYSGIEETQSGVRFKGSPCIVGRDAETFQYAKIISTRLGLRHKEGENYYGVPELKISKEKWFRELMLSCGIDVGEHKFIAETLKLSKKENVAALLQGIFDTDGSVQKMKNISFSNISLDLIKDTQRLLLTFGIVSRIRERKGKPMRLKPASKQYQTKNYYELTIAHKKSILDFNESIGFRINRKQRDLGALVDSIAGNLHFVHCKNCSYKLYADLFDGRTKLQQNWGSQKRQIIEFLGKNGATKSFEIAKSLGFACFKGEQRLDHHFELIERKRSAKAKIWRLNRIGMAVYNNIICSEKSINELLSSNNCVLCDSELEKKIKSGWRENDFEGDIYWDFVRNVTSESAENYPFVYDVVLPSDGSNDHLFIAEGFLVHNSAGVNLPAFRVIIPSPYRYSGFGMEKIPVYEFKQMSGRAGRPKYDSEGQAILIAKTEMEKDDYFDYFINGQIERIDSSLGNEKQLRFHLLSAIATHYVHDLDSAEKFFSATFYASQNNGVTGLFKQINTIIKKLEELEFVIGDENYIEATPLGQRVSELYLDPISANQIITMLRKNLHADISYLYLITSLDEFYPWVSIPRGKEGETYEQIQLEKQKIPVNVDVEMFTDNDFLSKYYSCIMLREWISEVREQEIVDKFKVQPGILHLKLDNADWISYSALELAKVLQLEGHYAPLNKIRKRLETGIREELIPLAELRGIGRVRARRLYNAGVKGIADVKNTDVRDLEKILGQAVALSIKEQLEMKK